MLETGSLINAKNFCTAIVIVCSLVIAAPAQRRKSRGADSLVAARKPAVYITFLRSTELEPLRTGYGRKHLQLRITNNTRWKIWLEMNDVSGEYGDAGLFYTIEDKEDGRIKIDARCHVCSVNPVDAGRSIIFSIPAEYASSDTRMRVEYSFGWERDNETEGGSDSTHSVLFDFSYLPKSE